MKTKTRLLIVGLLALLLFGSASVASAQEPAQPAKGPVVQGRVELKSETGLQLSTQQGAVAVRVDEQTRYHPVGRLAPAGRYSRPERGSSPPGANGVPGLQQPTLANIHMGDHVAVLGRRDDAGILLARLVKVLPPLAVNGLNGKVKAVEGQNITVTTLAGDKVLATDENTRFRVAGVEQATLSDIHVGDPISAIVQTQDDGSLLARMVAVIPEGAHGPITLKGRVVRVGDGVFRIMVRSNVVAVDVTATTQAWVPGIENPTLSNIQVGDWVLVIGRAVGRFRVEALGLIVLPPVSAHRYIIAGEVKSIEGTTLTVVDKNDTHEVHTDAQTHLYVPGVEQPTLADIHVGDQILTLGKPEANKALLARWIAVKPAPTPADSNLPSVEPPEF